MAASCHHRHFPQSNSLRHRVAWATCALLLTLDLSTHEAANAAEPVAKGTIVEGKVSWYGKKFTGRTTASGERFDHNAMTMAHPTWPFGAKVRVTNPANDKSVVLRINDRGPSIPDRIADVSSGAAQKLDIIRVGVAPLRLEIIELAPKKKSR
jgi:rare lipoprotein A